MILISSVINVIFVQVLVDEPDMADSGDTKALENGADSDIDDGMVKFLFFN